jgi:hypothetical protein
MHAAALAEAGLRVERARLRRNTPLEGAELVKESDC